MKVWFFVMLLFIFTLFLSQKEGLKTGKYDYLFPLLPEDTWGHFTIQKFVDKYNAMGNDQLNAYTFTENEKGSTLIKNALESEALYYAEHGRWPYNSYVTNYLESNPTMDLKVGDVTITKENIANYYPNRYVYMLLIAPKEAGIKPLPESYQIFKGAALPKESFTTLSNSAI